MTVRTKVYGSLGFLLLAGAGAYLWKVKPAWLPGMATAKAAATTKDEQSKGQKEAVPVELAAARLGEISAFVTATANLRALRDVAIATQAEGIVESVLVEEGDTVKEQQLLCRLDDTQHRIRLELAKEKLAQARLQMEKANIRDKKRRRRWGTRRPR